MKSRRVAVGSTVAALGIAVIGAHEGLRLKSYRDVIGIPTVCYGETRGIRMGMKFTKPECDAMLLKGLDEFAAQIEKCAPDLADAGKTPETRYVAHLSLAYNIGAANYCGSTLVRKFNAGDTKASCEEFARWDRAGGRVLPGLTRRRAEERQLCLQGL